MTNPPYENPDSPGGRQDGDELPEESLLAWVELIAGFSPRIPADVVEVRSGSGMLGDALIRHGRAIRVLGVELSLEEWIPAKDGEFDLALLSRVVHLMPDRTAFARELARVLRSDGVVVIRTTFRERLDADLYSYWPQALEADLRRFPRRDEIVADFAAAGFRVHTETSLKLPDVQAPGEYREHHDVLVLAKSGDVGE